MQLGGAQRYLFIRGVRSGFVQLVVAGFLVQEQRNARQQVAVGVGHVLRQLLDLLGHVRILLIGLLALEAVRAHHPEVVPGFAHAFDVNFCFSPAGQVQKILQLVGAMLAEFIGPGSPQAFHGGALIAGRPEVFARQQGG